MHELDEIVATVEFVEGRNFMMGSTLHPLSSFIELAVLHYLSSAQYVDNAEMEESLQDGELVRNLEEGRDEVKNGDYTFIPRLV